MSAKVKNGIKEKIADILFRSGFDIGSRRGIKSRTLSMSRRILFTLLIVVLVGAMVMSTAISYMIKKTLLTNFRNTAIDYVTFAATLVDGADFVNIDADSEGSEECGRIFDALISFKENSSVQYICAYRQIENGDVVFVVDVDYDEPAPFYEVLDATDAVYTALAGTPEADAEETTDRWGSYLSSYAPVFYDGEVVGIIGADFEYSAIAKRINASRIMVLGAFTILLGGILAAAMYISYRLSKGFNALNDEISSLADGSGNLSRTVQIKSGDEFEVLGNSVNAFIGEVRKLVNEVATASTENAGTLAKVNDSIMDVSASMEECSSSSETISANLANASDAVDSLADNIGHVQEIVSEANVSAAKAKDYATEHEAQAVSQMLKIIKEIEKAVEDAKAVEQVRQIAGNIEGIATQTKLLSLNAQIEASHAGSRGKGFAVVATEVQDLSIKISDSVSEISEISDKALSAMENLRKRVSEVTEYMTGTVAQDYKSFAQLGSDYGDATLRITEEMNALKQQSEVIANNVSGVNTSIIEINHAVGTSAAQISAITESSLKIGSSMNDLLEIPLLKAGLN